MIKFFRKIRHRLLTENKFSKYLIYAIGEIVLVVIGILIALNLNNKNLKHQEQVSTDNLFKEILKDLSIDIVEANKILEIETIKDSLMDMVMRNQVTAESYVPDSGFKNLIVNYETMPFSDNGYNNLAQNIDKIPNEYKKILSDLNKLHLDYKVEVEKWNIKLADYVYQILEKWAQTKPWFSSNMMGDSDLELAFLNEDNLKFFLNDPFYKNDVALFQIYMRDNHIPNIKKYKHQAVLSYKAISKVLEQDKKLPDYITSYMAEIPISMLTKYEGSYLIEVQSVQDTIKIIADEGKLNIISSDDEILELFPKTDLEFFSLKPDLIFIFNRNSNAEIIGFKLKTSGKEFDFNKFN